MKKLVIGLLLMLGSSSLSAVLAAELDLTASPAFVTVSGKRYAIVQLGNSVTFTTSPSASATFSWTFNNGSPASGSGNGPFDVTYSTTAAQGIANAVTFTSTRSSTHNGNPITCTTTGKVTADVLVPKFDFANNQSVTSSGVNNYVKSGTTVSSGKLVLTTDTTITLGVQGISIGTLASNEDSNATFSPTSGTTSASGTFTTAFSSSDATDQISMQFTSPAPASTVIKSQLHNMTPAVFQDKFRCTVYFTTKEVGYSTSTSSYTVYSQAGPPYTLIGSFSFRTDFATDVQTEGYGRTITPVETGKPFIAYYGGKYHDDQYARGNNGGNILAPQGDGPGSGIHTCAVDPTVVPLASSSYVKFTNSSISSAFGTSEFNANDIGSSVSGDHIDLYFGEDVPTSAGSGVAKDCTFTGDSSGSYTETTIYVGTSP